MGLIEEVAKTHRPAHGAEIPPLVVRVLRRFSAGYERSVDVAALLATREQLRQAATELRRLAHEVGQREVEARRREREVGEAREQAAADVSKLSEIGRRREREVMQLRAQLEQARPIARVALAEKARADELERGLARERERADASVDAEAALRRQLTVVKGELGRASAEAAAAHARVQELRIELCVERTRAEVENGALEHEIEGRRRAEAQLVSLTEAQRKSLELTLGARAVEQRERELGRKQAENDELRREVDRLAGKAGEVEVLRRKVCDLEALGFAHRPASIAASTSASSGAGGGPADLTGEPRPLAGAGGFAPGALQAN